MKIKTLEDDIVEAINNTINNSNCEDDAKEVIRIIINMYAALKTMDYIIDTKEGEIK